MSKIVSFDAPFTQNNRQNYTQYLEDQIQKLFGFMLYQKKQNQKNGQLMNIIEDQNQKIKLMNDKVLLLQLYQNQNFKSQQKLTSSVQKAIELQKRVNKLQYVCFQDKLFHKGPTSDCHAPLITRQISTEIEYRVNKIHQELLKQITRLQRNLLKKLNKIFHENQISKNNYAIKQKVKMSESKENMSPLQTNYSQNAKSQLKQFAKTPSLSQKQILKIERRISNFVNQNQKLSKHESQLAQINKYHNDSLHNSLKQSEIFNQPSRSPISAYLKKENQYNSSKQNYNFSSKPAVSKPFYSACEQKKTKLNKNTVKRSKSKSISNRSISKSNKSKSKSKQGQDISEFKLLKQQSHHSKPSTKRSAKTQRIIKNHESIKKIKDQSSMKTQTKFLKKTMKSNKKQNEISQLSQLSSSQLSKSSKSRSKSNRDKYKDQKQYMMYCNKLH